MSEWPGPAGPALTSGRGGSTALAVLAVVAAVLLAVVAAVAVLRATSDDAGGGGTTWADETCEGRGVDGDESRFSAHPVTADETPSPSDRQL